jgi:hypothetical protein
VIRIEFEPSGPKAAYKAQLRWASVTDQVKEDDSGAGSYRGTNQAGARFEAAPADRLEFATPGGPEVVVQRKGGGAL